MSTDTEFLTVPEVAVRLRKSEEFVRRELTRLNLRGHKVGGEWRIKPSDYDRYVNALANITLVAGRSA